MSEDAGTFALAWINENVAAGPYAPEGELHPDAGKAVEKLLVDATARGIARQDLEDAVGDLHDFVSNAFEDATDAEVERLANKDD